MNDISSRRDLGYGNWERSEVRARYCHPSYDIKHCIEIIAEQSASERRLDKREKQISKPGSDRG